MSTFWTVVSCVAAGFIGGFIAWFAMMIYIARALSR